MLAVVLMLEAGVNGGVMYDMRGFVFRLGRRGLNEPSEEEVGGVIGRGGAAGLGGQLSCEAKGRERS